MRPNERVRSRSGRYVALAAVGVAVLVAACDRRKPAAESDSVAPSTPVVAPAESAAAPEVVSGWDREAGNALVVPGEDASAIVVVPGAPGDGATDRTAGAATDVLPADVALFSRAGTAGRARATATTESSGCGWPTARLGPATGADILPAWTVGFVGGAPTPVALDSIEGLSAADSAALAATVTRLANSLRDDTLRALRGIPFTVRSARRFPIGDGRDGLVAVLTRALNQEASPLVEQLLLVAERPHGGAASVPWVVAYHERDAGREEEVPATDVLAAAALGGPQRPALVLARALADGSRYALLERTGDLAWRLRWSSAVRGC